MSPTDEKYVKIRRILSGEESIKLHLEFLYRNNHTDLLILKNTKVFIQLFYLLVKLLLITNRCFE